MRDYKIYFFILVSTCSSQQYFNRQLIILLVIVSCLVFSSVHMVIKVDLKINYDINLYLYLNSWLLYSYLWVQLFPDTRYLFCFGLKGYQVHRSCQFNWKVKTMVLSLKEGIFIWILNLILKLHYITFLHWQAITRASLNLYE